MLRMIGWACLSLGWLIPDHIPPWNTFAQEIIAFFGVIFLWPWRKLKFLPVRIYAAAFTFATAITVHYLVWDLERGDLLWTLSVTWIACMAATLGHQLSLQHSQLHGWLLVILGAALANTVIGLAQWLDVTQGIFMLGSPGRVYGNFAQSNHFATLIALGIGALIYLDTDRPLPGLWAHLAALILVVGLAASESRTGALSLTLMVTTVAVLGRRKKISTTLRWLLPALLAFWILYTVWAPLSAALGTSASRQGVGIGTSTRFELWMQMFEAISLNPWSGYGWLQIGAAQNSVAAYMGGTINMDHAHNLFLDLVVWFGVPLGGIAALACIAWWIQMTHHACRPDSPLNGLCCILMLLPIVVHSLLEYPLAYVYFLVVFAYFAGTLEASIGHTRAWSNRGWIAARLATLLTTMCSTLLANDYIHIEEDFRAVRLEHQFVTKQEHLHAYHRPATWLTSYGALVTILRKDLNASPESRSLDSARSIVIRFPWLITYQHYYILLQKNIACKEANDTKLVIQSIFGEFGIKKIEEEMMRQGVKDRCSF